MSTKDAIIKLMSGFTAETTPGSAKKVENFNDHLEQNSWVYVTFLPGSDLKDTITLCKRLTNEGMRPIPHFAARSLASEAVLEDMLVQVTNEAGVERVLTIAGGVSNKDIVGPFKTSMQLLETGLFDKYNIKTIAVAGHPEGSPDMSDEAIWDAVHWKNSFAERTDAKIHMVTQFCFEAEPIMAWDKKLNAAGNKMPVHVGLPGLATIKTLISLAKASGVGPSMRFLTRQAMNVHKLVTVSDPNKQLTQLARYISDTPNTNIEGIHMYPLGGLRRTAAWSYAVLQGDFTLQKDDLGFKMNTDIK